MIGRTTYRTSQQGYGDYAQSYANQASAYSPQQSYSYGQAMAQPQVQGLQMPSIHVPSASYGNQFDMGQNSYLSQSVPDYSHFSSMNNSFNSPFVFYATNVDSSPEPAPGLEEAALNAIQVLDPRPPRTRDVTMAGSKKRASTRRGLGCC